MNDDTVVPVEMHADQLVVYASTVRSLIADQFPQWAGLPVTPWASEGTVNAIFRIGEELAARFPLRKEEPSSVWQQLEAEAEATRELIGGTRFPVPQPVALGEPGAGYPLPWSIQTWLPGTTATDDDPGNSDAFAHDLAEFILELRALDTRGRTFTGSGRGGDLASHEAWMQTCFARSTQLLDVPALRQLWEKLRDLPRRSPDAVTHGDLMPGNVLVADGRLAGILDAGGLAPADPSLDLVGAWHLLEEGPRDLLREDLGCGDLEWSRGMAWALEQAIGLVWYYQESKPSMSQTGRRTLTRLLAADAP